MCANLVECLVVSKGSSFSWVTKLQGDNYVWKLPRGGHEVRERERCFCLQEDEWSRSYKERSQHPNHPESFMTHGFLHPSAFPERRVKWLGESAQGHLGALARKSSKSLLNLCKRANKAFHLCRLALHW